MKRVLVRHGRPDATRGEADRHLTADRSTETRRRPGQGVWPCFLADPVRYLGHEPQRCRDDVLQALASTLGEAPREARVGVVTHGLAINQVLSHVLGLERIVHFQPSLGSLTRLRARDARTVGVVSVNESGHHAWPEAVPTT